MTPEDQKARDEFEAWYVARQRLNGYGSFLIDSEFVRRMPSGRYRSLPLEDAWQAWQESRRTYRATVLEEAALACEKVGDDYGESEGGRWPEMKSDAQTGARDCESAIRALASPPPCTGRNCATTTANHSPECVADHLRAVAGKE